MKEMIQKNKGRLICSAFVMCIGMILGYTCENSLWVNGTFAVTYVVAMAVTFYDNRNRQAIDSKFGCGISNATGLAVNADH